MSVVNSWNEWDPLQEVIVGTARGAFDIGFEPALAPYFSSGSEKPEFRGRPVHPVVVDDAERQLDHFADLLNGLGITVRRPDPIDHGVTVQTPDWQVPGGHASACPRDILLVVGNEIIEAPMAQRARYFEFRWISMNILMLDGHTVVVEQAEKPKLFRTLWWSMPEGGAHKTE